MKQVPLAEKVRPKTLDDIFGQRHILGSGKLLRRMIEADMLSSIILYGPPGTGKTSIANVIAHQTNSEFRQINATTSGKADMKSVVDSAEKLWKEENRGTILFIDEIHRFNKAQQDFLLPYVENGTVVLIGATTENPYFEVNGALLSRSNIFELKPLSKDDIITGVWRVIHDTTVGYGNVPVDVSTDAMDYLASVADGDMRRAISAVELAMKTTMPDADGTYHLTVDVMMECTQKRVMRFDKSGDNHYDFISAYIESMKHSDVDASLYYLARMIEAGEDPKYIARQLVIHSAEDVGLADPTALNLAVSTFLAIERVGMPEGIHALALTTVYIAAGPKSHSVCDAVGQAMSVVKQTGNLAIPSFLQDESYKSAHKLGRGGVSDIYQYEGHYDGTDCMPAQLKGLKFLHIDTPYGYEGRVKGYLQWCDEYRKQHELV